MNRSDSQYEPPAAEVVPSDYGLVETAAGVTSYGAITLMEDDDKPSSE